MMTAVRTGAAVIIAVEGLPGSGKSDLIERLRSYLNDIRLGVSVVTLVSHERRKRSLMALAESYPVGDVVRTLILWALRILQYRTVQKVRYEKDVVIMDRTAAAMFINDYHGGTLRHRVPLAVLKWVMQFMRGTRPHMTIFLDLPWEVAAKRKESRTLQDPERAQRLQDAYRKRAQVEGWLFVDATQPQEAVRAEVVRIIADYLKRRNVALETRLAPVTASLCR